jgi:predicted component of type VI protein secretion system
MDNRNPKQDPRNTDEEEEISEYDEFDILERLETLREDMEELGVTTLAEVIQRIDEMHRRLDRQ